MSSLGEGGEDVSDENGGTSDIESLEEQVATLTQALNTLTDEKAKMEASFQQDKKHSLVSEESKIQ